MEGELGFRIEVMLLSTRKGIISHLSMISSKLFMLCLINLDLLMMISRTLYFMILHILILSAFSLLKIMEFLLFQMNHIDELSAAIMISFLILLAANFRLIYVMASKIEVWKFLWVIGSPIMILIQHHICLEKGQLKNICLQVSTSLLHSTQTSSSVTPCIFNLSFVGRKLKIIVWFKRKIFLMWSSWSLSYQLVLCIGFHLKYITKNNIKSE